MISVILPVFNGESYLSRSITSVLRQNEQAFRLIIVDDGSTDRTYEIAKQFETQDRRIRVIRQNNQGVAIARNVGLSCASTDHVAFLDCDDEWDWNFLSERCKLISDFPECALFGCSYRRISTSGAIRYNAYNAVPTRGRLPNFFLSAVGRNPIWTSVASVNRALALKHGGFPPKVTRMEDLMLWGKLAMHYPVAFDSKVLATRHLDTTGRLSIERPDPYGLPLLEYAKHCEGRLTSETWFRLVEYVHSRELKSASAYIQLGEYRRARKILGYRSPTTRFRSTWGRLLLETLWPVRVLRGVLRN